MGTKFLIIIFFLGFYFLSFHLVQAANSLDVFINEIAWMGTEISYNDEWIELYNNTDSEINLEGWTLKTDDGTPEISLLETIPAKGFYLLERTDDDTIPGISADQIYVGALKNSGENLGLYDNLNNLIDSVNGWTAGNNSTKQTMERNGNSWQTSQSPGGTPKAQNSNTSQPLEPIPETQPIEKQGPNTEPIKNKPGLLDKPDPEENLIPIIYPSGIVINELLPSPEGPDSESEWIEIFNQNSFGADLFEWEIKDVVGKTRTYIFPKETIIESKGYLVLSRPTTQITLNNSGDGLRLVKPDGEIADSVDYGKSLQKQSYNRTGSGWTWSESLTPGTLNIILEEKSKETNLEKPIPKKPSTLASAKQSSKSPLTLIISLVFAIFSGIIILILKRKVYNKNV